MSDVIIFPSSSKLNFMLCEAPEPAAGSGKKGEGTGERKVQLSRRWALTSPSDGGNCCSILMLRGIFKDQLNRK